jgi:hypothetical protein
MADIAFFDRLLRFDSRLLVGLGQRGGAQTCNALVRSFRRHHRQAVLPTRGERSQFALRLSQVGLLFLAHHHTDDPATSRLIAHESDRSPPAGCQRRLAFKGQNGASPASVQTCLQGTPFAQVIEGDHFRTISAVPTQTKIQVERKRALSKNAAVTAAIAIGNDFTALAGETHALQLVWVSSTAPRQMGSGRFERVGRARLQFDRSFSC